MKPLLFSLPGGEAFAARLQAHLGCEAGGISLRRFPDGETSVRLLTAVAGRDVILACALQDPDPKVVQLYLTASVARELGANSIGFVIPYLPYMRQDARFKEGEGITSAHFARLLSSCCDWLVTVDPHLHRHHALSDIYTAATRVAHAAPAIAAWIAVHVERPFIVGPDGESAQWVSEVAAAAGCPYVVLDKVRHDDREVNVSVLDPGSLKGRTPVLVDDIVSTACTMIAAAGQLHAAGMGAPVCIAVHPLFAAGAYEALLAAGVARVASCNTIPHSTNLIDVSAPVAAAVGELLAAAGKQAP